MIIINKKANLNYRIFEKIEAGIVLLGSEAKSLRTRGGDLSNCYAKVIQGEVYLINLNIPIENKKDYDSKRSRKLLLHKNEIVSISSKIKAQGLTLIPIKLYNKGPLFKLELALAKSKRKYEKKESIKKRDIEREIESELRNSIKYRG